MKKLDMESYNSGAALPSMTTDILNRMKFIIPSSDILKNFDELIETLFQKKTQLLSINENLTCQRDLLLPRLMSGKLEV